jgi:hypothetical protein
MDEISRRISRLPEPWRARASAARDTHTQIFNENCMSVGATAPGRFALERFFLRNMMIAIEDGESVNGSEAVTP